MSRKYNRKEQVVSLATRVLEKEVKNPAFINNIVIGQIKKKPDWLPQKIWTIILDLVIQNAYTNQKELDKGETT